MHVQMYVHVCAYPLCWVLSFKKALPCAFKVERIGTIELSLITCKLNIIPLVVQEAWLFTIHVHVRSLIVDR